jgi:tetratricopeptide (TPR) repeat protein
MRKRAHDVHLCHPSFGAAMNETIIELLERADALLDRGDAQGALDLLQGATGRWTESACASLHLLSGRCHVDLQQFAEAERAFRRSLAIERRPETLSFLAHTLMREGRDAESLGCLREVLEIDPKYEEAHYNLGCHLRRTGDSEAALECFQRAIDIDPDYAVAHAELGFVLMRRRHSVDGQRSDLDVHRALRHLWRSVKLDPQYHWSRLYLGNLLWSLRRLRQARTHYEAAARLMPDDGFVLATCADFVSTVSGGGARAKSLFRRAIELAPQDPFVRCAYGTHLLRAKRHSEARRELELADRLGHPRAHKLLANLDED